MRTTCVSLDTPLRIDGPLCKNTHQPNRRTQTQQDMRRITTIRHTKLPKLDNLKRAINEHHHWNQTRTSLSRPATDKPNKQAKSENATEPARQDPRRDTSRRTMEQESSSGQHNNGVLVPSSTTSSVPLFPLLADCFLASSTTSAAKCNCQSLKSAHRSVAPRKANGPLWQYLSENTWNDKFFFRLPPGN